ncbi:MAG: hypothetical protein JXB34_05235 [Bacteroidales bacterium]|nr:hypothetical protein [Bacteroidales bacterium]
MKKHILIIILLTIVHGLYANPIPLPTIEISELYFDQDGHWELELRFDLSGQNEISFDSIFISSLSGTVKLPEYELNDFSGLLVITDDSLGRSLGINNLGDTVKLLSYCMELPLEDILIFGNCKGAVIGFPRPGQSLSKCLDFFVKDNSPTIGQENDTEGSCGTVTGLVYDKFLHPAANRKFKFDFNFETSETGSYTANVYARPATHNLLTYFATQFSIQDISITEISYLMEPDSVIERDIYLLDTLKSGLQMPELKNSPVQVFPNPVMANNKINLHIDLPFKTSDITVELIGPDGRILNKKKVASADFCISSPDNAGVFILSVFSDGKIISSTRVLVLHE